MKKSLSCICYCYAEQSTRFQVLRAYTCSHLDVVDTDIALLDGVDGVGDDDDDADRDNGGEEADDEEAALRLRKVGHPAAARVFPPARVGARTASFLALVPNLGCRRDAYQSVTTLGAIHVFRYTCVDGRGVGLGRTELLLKLRNGVESFNSLTKLRNLGEFFKISITLSYY